MRAAPNCSKTPLCRPRHALSHSRIIVSQECESAPHASKRADHTAPHTAGNRKQHTATNPPAQVLPGGLFHRWHLPLEQIPRQRPRGRAADAQSWRIRPGDPLGVGRLELLVRGGESSTESYVFHTTATRLDREVSNILRRPSPFALRLRAGSARPPTSRACGSSPSPPFGTGSTRGRACARRCSRVTWRRLRRWRARGRAEQRIRANQLVYLLLCDSAARQGRDGGRRRVLPDADSLVCVLPPCLAAGAHEPRAAVRAAAAAEGPRDHLSDGAQCWNTHVYPPTRLRP